MEAAKGMVVRSRAGRDKGTFLVVTEVKQAGEFVLLADGKHRPLERPKLKRLKHLALTSTVLDLDEATNQSLRRALRGFSPEASSPEQGEAE